MRHLQKKSCTIREHLFLNNVWKRCCRKKHVCYANTLLYWSHIKHQIMHISHKPMIDCSAYVQPPCTVRTSQKNIDHRVCEWSLIALLFFYCFVVILFCKKNNKHLCASLPILWYSTKEIETHNPNQLSEPHVSIVLHILIKLNTNSSTYTLTSISPNLDIRSLFNNSDHTCICKFSIPSMDITMSQSFQPIFRE